MTLQVYTFIKILTKTLFKPSSRWRANMIRNRIITLQSICFICAICVGFLSTTPVYAQDTERTIKTKVVKVNKTTRVAKLAVAIDPVAALTADIEQCGASCSMGGPNSISAGDGSVRDYDCNDDGNCHCFGAIDCVAMSKICAEGTLGCNDQGCVCTEGDG